MGLTTSRTAESKKLHLAHHQKHQTKICKEKHNEATKQRQAPGQWRKDSFDPVNWEGWFEMPLFQSSPTSNDQRQERKNMGKNKGTIPQWKNDNTPSKRLSTRLIDCGFITINITWCLYRRYRNYLIYYSLKCFIILSSFLYLFFLKTEKNWRYSRQWSRCIVYGIWLVTKCATAGWIIFTTGRAPQLF